MSSSPTRGRCGSTGASLPLIELTGGFEGRPTARENVYLAGGLHGLGRAQIDEQFEEIVVFAEIQDFVDTPFRFFSSGMKVRLGFAVVTTLDEPIVLVDEVLAVGDKKFREKCYARLDETCSGTAARCSWSRTARPTCSGSAPGACTCATASLITDGPIDKAIDDYNAYQDK